MPEGEPFKWHAPNGEIREPPRAVVDYLDAVKDDNLEKLRDACARGAHPDTRHRCGMPGLIISADLGHYEVVEYLLNAGANVHNQWSMQPALYYAEKRLRSEEEEVADKKQLRQRTFDLLKEWSDKTPLPLAPEPVPSQPVDDLLGSIPPKPPIKYKPTATEDNIKDLLDVISDGDMSDMNREDAAWALRHMTEPTLAQRKRNVGLLVNMGAVDILIDVLCAASSVHEIKEQSVAVLRNIARETASKKSVAHQIRKVIRQEAAKWAGLGTPESDARIKAMDEKIKKAGGVCVVKTQEEIENLEGIAIEESKSLTTP